MNTLDANANSTQRAQAALECCLDAARSPLAHAAFVALDAHGAQVAAQHADLRRQQGLPALPLDGVAISVKDLFDVAGQVTTAGSRVLATQAPARHDATAVARLRAAGAALIGRTQMTEFAFSGVGINPHHGTPANVAMRAFSTEPCVPGGSSSGAAVSVAAGAAWAALGTDTGGSIRIPAALHGLVGFKNSQHLIPLTGCVPLSPALDTTCAITRSVRDAIVVHEVLADRRVSLSAQPLAGWRLGLLETMMLDNLDPAVAQAFERTVQWLSAAGAQIVDLSLPAMADLPVLQQDGGLPAAQSWAWHRARLEDPTQAALYDPRVAARIRRGAAITPDAEAALHQHRADWIDRMQASLSAQQIDAVLSPTVPLVAPTLAPLLTDDALFFHVNALLLRNPAVVNLLDGCAISLPCHREDEVPVGLMLWSTRDQDDRLLSIALAVEVALQRPRQV